MMLIRPFNGPPTVTSLYLIILTVVKLVCSTWAEYMSEDIGTVGKDMGAAFFWQGFCILILYILDEKKMMYTE